jgi:hypothetical protein
VQENTENTENTENSQQDLYYLEMETPVVTLTFARGTTVRMVSIMPVSVFV